MSYIEDGSNSFTKALRAGSIISEGDMMTRRVVRYRGFFVIGVKEGEWSMIFP